MIRHLYEAPKETSTGEARMGLLNVIQVVMDVGMIGGG